jgi:hypothetical protein
MKAREITGMTMLFLFTVLTLTSSIQSVKSSDSEVLFFDDFNDGVADGWAQHLGNWGVISGEYHVRVGVVENGISTVNGLDLNNCVIETNLRFSDAEVGFRAGIVFRYIDNEHYYSLEISNEYDEIAIHKYTPENPGYGVSPQYLLFQLKPTIQPNIDYTLRVEMSGTTFVGFLNGEKMVTVQDDTYQNGKVGLRARRADASFDDFTVYSIETLPPVPPVPGGIGHLEKTSSGKIAYDTFSALDGTATDIPWTIFHGNWVVEEGKFRSESLPHAVAFPTGIYVTDVVWEAKVKPMLLKTEGPEIIFRAGTIEQQTLEAVFDYYHTTRLLRVMITPGPYGTSYTTYQITGFEMAPGTWYTMKVVVSGTNLRAYVDGVLKFDIIDLNMGSAPPRRVDHRGYYNGEWGYWDDVKIWKSNTIKIANLQEGQKAELYDNANNLRSSDTVGTGETQALLDVSSLTFPFTGYFKIYATDGITLLHTSELYQDIWGGDEYSFSVPSLEIDQTFVSDARVDIDSSQTIGFHAKWVNNSSDVIEASISVNGTGYVTNGTGWIIFNYSSSSVGRKTWVINGVNANGVTSYRQTVENPSIIWDRVMVTLQNNRVNVGNEANISYQAIYEYDKETFSGSIMLNDTVFSQDVLGKRGYKPIGIMDEKYQLTQFTSNEAYVVFDLIKASYQIETLSPGTLKVTVNVRYEYDDAPVVDATVKVNNVIGENIGNGMYEVNLPLWMPYQNIEIEVGKIAFAPVKYNMTVHSLGNIGLWAFMSVSTISALAFSRAKWIHKRKLRHLKDLIEDRKKTSIDEVAKIMNIKTSNAEKLLHELTKRKMVEGFFTSDGKTFVTEEKLKEEILRDYNEKGYISR